MKSFCFEQKDKYIQCCLNTSNCARILSKQRTEKLVYLQSCSGRFIVGVIVQKFHKNLSTYCNLVGLKEH